MLELLRQSRNQLQDNTCFSRSGAVQNLSILISSLEWIVRPGIGNFALCIKARSMLKRSLDRILDPSLLNKGEPDGMMTPSSDQAMPVPNTDEANAFAVADSSVGWNGEDWLGMSADPGLGKHLQHHILLHGAGPVLVC